MDGSVANLRMCQPPRQAAAGTSTLTICFVTAVAGGCGSGAAARGAMPGSEAV